MSRCPRALVASCAAVLLATGLLCVGSLPAGPAVALAATPDLTLVTSTRYDVRPELGRIDVTVNLTATNNLVDTATKTYVFQRAYLAVQPEAGGFGVSSGTGHPTVTVSESKPTYQLLEIAFGASLAAGRSTNLTLTYALTDPGAPPDRDLRIGATLTTFQAWALASTATPGSTVTVTVPAGYTVTFPRGTIPGPTGGSEGLQTWTSAPIDDPLAFDLYIQAERPPQLVDSTVTVPVGGVSSGLTFRAWSDDPGWATRMADWYRVGLPALATAIGRPWPLDRPLIVEEVLGAPTGGIAGTFDPAANRIQVVYSAGPETALHELAHAWFNGGLLADRWANEGFASYYAETVATDLGLPFEPAAVPDLKGAQVPLNAWASGDAQPPEGADQSAVEAYGYAASAELARRIADRIGAAGLQRVWSAIDAGVAPYQPPGGPTEYLNGPPDWKGLLDLLEDDGTTKVADLWGSLVVRPSEAASLGDRNAARRAYADALAKAGGWQLPKAIRDALRSWNFATAGKQLALAATVLSERDTLAQAVEAAGLTLPSGLQGRFETATDLTPVRAEVDADVKAIAAIRAAQAAEPASVGVVEWFALIGASPDLQLRDAIAAFGAGDPATAETSASRAEATWREAAQAGRDRAVVLAAALAVVLLGAWIWLRGLRRAAG